MKRIMAGTSILAIQLIISVLLYIAYGKTLGAPMSGILFWLSIGLIISGIIGRRRSKRIVNNANN